MIFIMINFNYIIIQIMNNFNYNYIMRNFKVSLYVKINIINNLLIN